MGRILFVTVFVILALAGCDGSSSRSNNKNGMSRRWERSDFSTQLVAVYYWNSTAGYLMPSWREIPFTESLTARAESILAALSEDPPGGAESPLHPELNIGTVFFDGEETIFIEFFQGESGAGSSGEALAAKAVCMSLKENLPEIGAVEFIAGGDKIPEQCLHIIHEYH